MDYGLDPELLAQQPGLEAQDVLAQLLRKQAMQGVQSPEGQMISGHYVAPNILQHIAAAMRPAQQRDEAAQIEQATAKKRTMLQQALQAAQNQWLGEMPQGIPGSSGQAPVQGAPIERGGQLNQEATGTPAVPPQLPSALEQMRWVAKGSQIPGTTPLAAVLGKTLESERAREDEQQAKRENLQASLIERLQTKKMEVDAQLQKERMGNASAERIAAIQDGWHKYVADALAESKKAQGKELTPAQQETKNREEQRQIEHYDEKVSPLLQLARAADIVMKTIDANTDPNTKSVKSIPGYGFSSILGASMGTLEHLGQIPKGSVKNNSDIQRVLNVKLRSNAGLSQTITEQQNTLKEILAGGKWDQEQFIAGFKQLVELLNQDIKEKSAIIGPEALEKLKQRGGGSGIKFEGVSSKFHLPQSIATDQGPATLGTPKVRVFNPTTGMLE